MSSVRRRQRGDPALRDPGDFGGGSADPLTRFGDSWRLGLPLSAIFLAFAVLYVPLVWPFWAQIWPF
ncbi:hypothetical protein [Agromyces silvae]|uniref:hypothetical protein n=1 Tax=Agromyces silvae TaxID=3388266 RepID=UPI00280B8EE8|nr:hypothetical protein [Agromyces protaetiae]